ncbi:MAG: hypothetical protein K6D94_01760 [Clostridiales bacterium]|nr:hypothetical protein [Clostridiales bacterium]
MENTAAAVFETKALRYTVDQAGFASGFIRAGSGTDYAEPGFPAFALLRGLPGANPAGYIASKGMDAFIMPDGVRQNGDTVCVSFPSVSFALKAECLSDHIRLTVAEIIPGDADFGCFLFGGAKIRDKGDPEGFCGCAVARSIRTQPLEVPGRCEYIGALAYSKLSPVGACAAIIGTEPECLREAAKSALSDVSINDGLVSRYGGPWGDEAPGSHDDYMIECAPVDFSTGEWIEAMRQKNISILDFHQGIEYRHGDYVFRQDKFPRGAEDFRRLVSDPLHANGMKAGLHTYCGMVDFASRYVAPVPHPDLYAVGEYTLAENIGPGDDVIITEEDASEMPLVQTPFASVHARTLMIDGELIEFTGRSGNSVTGCSRGAIGTTAQAHGKGAKIKHLRNMYNMFQSTPGSALYYELAENMARMYNDGGFDTMYFDGLECVGSCCSGEKAGLGWYYEAEFVRTVLKGIGRPALVEYSLLHGAVWNARSRAGAWDAATSGFRKFISLHCADNKANGMRRMLPCTLGWWEIYPPLREGGNRRPNWIFKAEYDDDIDYLGVRSIAYGMGLSYLSVSESMKAVPASGEKLSYLEGDGAGEYPQYHRLFSRLAGYSRVRQSGSLSSELLGKLSDPDAEFRLAKGERIGFTRQKRLFARPLGLCDDNTVKVDNCFGVQAPVIRVIAQCAADTSGSGRVIARFDIDRPLGDQERVIRFPDGLDLGGREALGLWVTGDGSGEYINVRLEGLPPHSPGYGDHVIKLDFTGRRFVSLCECDNGDFTDAVYLPDGERNDSNYRMYREGIDYGGIGAIRVMTSSDPSRVFIGDISAYPVDDKPVTDISVEAGGKRIVFGCSLAPGSWVEYDPENGSAMLFDIYGHTSPVPVTGEAPALAHGMNTVAVNGKGNGSYRLKLHMIISGETIY